MSPPLAGLLPVADALERVLALVSPLGVETVDLRHAAGRVMAGPAQARLTQPPFDASAMDGYAVAGPAAPGDSFRVIGTSAAGAGHGGAIGPGEAVRIFTGAPLPQGADRVVIQEDMTRAGETVTVTDDPGESRHVRPAGEDFRRGATFAPGRPLRPEDVAFLAAMGIDRVEVHRRAEVAIIATGDELVMPGEVPGPDQIVASNNLGLAALVEGHGGRARLLPIARDTEASLGHAFDLARGADLVVTIGGASVGDHDLVAGVAAARGMERAFYKVAMRPGKPLMAGRIDGMAMLGLPGNPVSSMVCGHVFLLPMLRVLHGLPPGHAPEGRATLAAPLAPNGPREHYMRARREGGGVVAADRQDSSLLGILATADVLIRRPAHDPARETGEEVAILEL